MHQRVTRGNVSMQNNKTASEEGLAFKDGDLENLPFI